MKLFKKMIEDKGKKGFTLVEMLIVLALLAILLSVAVPSFAGYVRRIKLMELDDSARAIFMAVQNKMTVMKQSGMDIETFGKTYDDGEMPEIFKKAAEPPADPANPTGNYVDSKAMYALSSDLKAAGENSLVTLSSIEGQLYKHNYVIEYDATTGRVFGVFYFEDSGLLSDYPAPSNSKLFARDFEDRLQADKLVGYYGGEGELVKVPVGGEVAKPTNVTNSTLEKLAFTLESPTNDDGSYKKGKYYFEVTITGKDAKGQEHTIDIVPYTEGDNSNNYYVEYVEGNPQKCGKGVVILDSIAPGCGTDNGQWNLPSDGDMSGYTLERDFKGWVYIRENVRNGFFSNNWNDIPEKKNSYSPYDHGVASWDLGKRYVTDNPPNAWEYAQYFRIDPGSDIEVSIKRCEEGGTLESIISSGIYSSYFNEPLNGSRCAKIAAGRHLQNLSNYVNKDLINSCSLEKDIDFSEDTGNYDSWNAGVTYKGKDAAHSYLYNFKPIFSQFVNDSNFAQEVYGNGKTIKYIRIDTVNDPRFNNDSSIYDSTGFFANVKNAHINNLKFYCPVVIGKGKYTGMLFGYCQDGTHVKNCTVINPIIEGYGDYVGGLLGEISGGGDMYGNKIYVEEVKKDEDTEEKGYFNNYTSDLAEREVRRDITWGDPRKDPYAYFGVIGKNETTYAGGLVGHTTGVFQQSAAAIRVVSEGYAGGLIGLAGGDISNCLVGGHTYNGSFVVPKGTNIGGTALDEDYYLINVNGKKASGGLAAESTGGITGNYTTCSVGKHTGGEADTFVPRCVNKSVGGKAYAIGSLIDVDNNTKTEQGSTWSSSDGFAPNLQDLINKNSMSKENRAVELKYDTFLPSEYPYFVDGIAGVNHLGDWPIEQNPAEGYGMFYWEIENGVYHIKAVGDFDGKTNETVSKLCTALDGNSITDHGYGYFYSNDITVDNNALGGQEVTDNTLMTKIESALNNADLREVTFRLLTDTTIGDKTITFTVAGVDKVFHYNPGFCALSTSSLTEYEIRSFEQLENLSNNSAYWDKNFSMSHDIPVNGNSLTPIGTSTTPFSGTFDGGCYRIANPKIDVKERNDGGIFGVVKNATIKNAIVFNADYTNLKFNDNAALGGIVGRALSKDGGSSTIENCAFTGNINVSSTVEYKDLFVGGIVGFADNNGVKITLQNCEAVANMTVKGNWGGDNYNINGVVAVGGIAGMVHKTPVSNCYSGGEFSASGGVWGQEYIGGIIGSTGRNDVRISNCYTYYSFDTDGSDYVHPIGNRRYGGGLLGGSVTFSNCCYYGTWDGNPRVWNEGLKEYHNFDDFKRLAAPDLYAANVGFREGAPGYGDNLSSSYRYPLPAIIHDDTKGNFHYGQSPDDTLVAGDKRLGVFYWEEEAGAYKLKVCYYNSPDDSSAITNDTLCTSKDGHSITRSGYGYFIGKGVDSMDVSFGDLPSIADGAQDYSGIKTSLENFLKIGDNSIDLANDFTFAFYDCSNSNDVEKTNVSVSDKDFWIIPGLCAIDKDEHVTRYVRTAQHLKNLSVASAADMEESYHQTHDIIFTGESINGFTPIGISGNSFKGTYDGGCYRICDIDKKIDAEIIGLFGVTENATIKDTFVIDGSFEYTGTGSPTMGGIVGRAVNNTRIENCIFTGDISSHNENDNMSYSGGIVGYCDGGTLTNCEATANITVESNTHSLNANIGGIAGTIQNAAVSSCYSGGMVKLGHMLGNVNVGGIVGHGNNNAVNSCYTHMNIPQFLPEGTSVKPNIHPIGNNVAPINCHYVESKNHYAHDFGNTGDGIITKHSAFGTIIDAINTELPGFSSIGADKTYSSGIIANSEITDDNNPDKNKPYPMPAVVKDGSTYVHYGEWNDDIAPIRAEAYGVFYWEIEDNDECHVRVKYIEQTSEGDFETKSVESKNFCAKRDGRAITQFGYGYFSCGAEPFDYADSITNGYSSGGEKNQADGDKIKAALYECGISGIHTLDWNGGTVADDGHGDKTVWFKKGTDGKQLKVGNNHAYVKFNRDFCYLYIDASGNPPSIPHEIRSKEQLSNIRYMRDEDYKIDGNFKQTHDINSLGNTYWKLSPIGGKIDDYTYSSFTGQYDGNGYRIINAKIDLDSGDYVGLFGYTAGATIENVTMFNADITVKSLVPNYGGIGAVGGIVGRAINTTIENCAFYGKISAAPTNDVSQVGIGGMVGYLEDTRRMVSIQNCESVADVQCNLPQQFANPVHIGGIAGGCNSGTIESCYSGGELASQNGQDRKTFVGGIVGSGKVTVSKCYSYAKITSDKGSKNPIGNGKVTIDKCYCLTGTNFYNHSLDDTRIKAYNENQIPKFIAALKSIFPDSSVGSNSRYDAEAYANDLTNRGSYPLAAVVSYTDNMLGSTNYVHYGNVAGLIKYKVDTEVNNPALGKVEVSSEYVLPNDTVTLTVEPEINCSLDSITITDSNGNTIVPAVTITPAISSAIKEYTFTMPEKNVKVNVEFRSLLHKIEVAPIIGDGSIYFGNGSVTSALAGNPVTFTATPDSGMKCKEVKVEKADGSPVNVTYTKDDKTEGWFIMPDADVTVTVEFIIAELPQGWFEITVNQTTGGTVSCVDYAQQNEEVTVTITPDEGYKVNDLTVTNEWGSQTYTEVDANTIKFTMPYSKVTINVEFAEKANYDAKAGLFAARWTSDWNHLEILPKFPEGDHIKPDSDNVVEYVGLMVDKSIDLKDISLEITQSGINWDGSIWTSSKKISLSSYMETKTGKGACEDITINITDFENYYLLRMDNHGYNDGNNARAVLMIDDKEIFNMGAVKENW